ncbi:hypothetical protein FRB90_000043 [Tulasnella sp. 427]|nr:hypothetical protein FRB90_000043 [Tulasnella sp. 427]
MSYLGRIPSEIIYSIRRLLSLLSPNLPRLHEPIAAPHLGAAATSPTVRWSLVWRWPRTLHFDLPVLMFSGTAWGSVFAVSASWVVDWFGLQDRRASDLGDGDDGVEEKEKKKRKSSNGPPSEIQKMMNSPVLFEYVRRPRNPIVLCHGLYGFDVMGPASFQRHYWSEVLEILRDKIKADVIVTGVPPTGSIQDRAKVLNEKLKDLAKGKEVNLFGHSMGGLDCRHLITHLRPKEYTPRSLTTIATPHRGSPFMDWCSHNIGIGALQDAVKSSRRPTVPYSLSSPILTRPTPSPSSSEQPTRPSDSAALSTLSPLVTYLATLPQSITTLILSYVDSPAYANLTTSYLNDVFNPATPNVEGIKYFSVTGRVEGMSIFHPLWLPKLILDKSEEVEQASLTSSGEGRSLREGRDGDKWPTSQIGRYPPHHELGNDGLVPISSAQWGEFLGVVDGADHWDIRGASGFSAQWELAGAAGGLGWVSGVDWSKLGIPWIGSGTKSPSTHKPSAEGTGSAAEKVKAALDTAKDVAVLKRKSSVTGSSDDEASRMMEWIGEHMAKATSERKVEDDSRKRREDPSIELRVPHPPKPLEEGKFDLERLYMALTRKLYDEGL